MRCVQSSGWRCVCGCGSQLRTALLSADAVRATREATRAVADAALAEELAAFIAAVRGRYPAVSLPAA